MQKLSVQFHALPQEVEELSRGLSDDPGVQTTRAPTFIAFTLSDANPAENPSKFIELNPDALVWETGHISEQGLSESWLWAMTGDERALRRWKQAAAALRSRTLTGAVAVHPGSGARAPMRTHRFSKGAQRAFADGLAMLPAAGNSRVLLPALDQA